MATRHIPLGFGIGHRGDVQLTQIIGLLRLPCPMGGQGLRTELPALIRHALKKSVQGCQICRIRCIGFSLTRRHNKTEQQDRYSALECVHGVHPPSSQCIH